MDEKLAVSTNALNEALKRQIDKRSAAPAPSHEAAAAHIADAVMPTAVPAASGSGLASFIAMWKAYYPKMVSILGWASWVVPGKALTIIKSLLAVVNNQIIPIIEAYEK